MPPTTSDTDAIAPSRIAMTAPTSLERRNRQIADGEVVVGPGRIRWRSRNSASILNGLDHDLRVDRLDHDRTDSFGIGLVRAEYLLQCRRDREQNHVVLILAGVIDLWVSDAATVNGTPFEGDALHPWRCHRERFCATVCPVPRLGAASTSGVVRTKDCIV